MKTTILILLFTTYALCAPPSWEISTYSLFAQAQPPVKLAIEPALTIAFVPQGAEALKALTGRVIPGVMLMHVTVDSGAAGVYLEAARAGISAIPPEIALPMLARTRQLNWKQILLDVGGVGASVTGTLGITNVVSMSNGLAALLASAPVLLRALTPTLRDRLPETGWQARLCPLRVEAGASCLMLARYQQMGPKVVEVK